jgi:hypothetical protein
VDDDVPVLQLGQPEGDAALALAAVGYATVWITQV